MNNQLDSEFKPIKIIPDQNVICVNNQSFQNNEINKADDCIDRISSLVLENKKEEEVKEPKKPRFRNKSYDVNEEVFAKRINLL